MAEKWNAFEEEGEGSRLRGDSDLTQEPKVPPEPTEAPLPVRPIAAMLGRRPAYVLPEEQALESESEYSQYIRVLRPYALGIVAMGVGILIGLVLFASPTESPTRPPSTIPSSKGQTSKTTGDDAHSESILPPTYPLTLSPTMLPTPFPTFPPSSGSPTKAAVESSYSLDLSKLDENDSIIPKNLITSDAAVRNVQDPRFGALYYISPGTVSRWTEQERLKNQLRPTLANDNLGFRQKVCEVKPNPPQKYAFPPREYAASKRPVSPRAFLRHVRQFKFALSEYYHQSFAHNVSDVFYNRKIAEPAVLRLAHFFRAKLLSPERMRISIATMGSSVMSGHDNCHYYTYGPLLNRTLSHLLAPGGAEVETKNMGQNGDGPDQESQMTCAWLTLGKTDFVHVWYPMMPQTSVEIKWGFVARMILQNQAQNIHLVDSMQEFVHPEALAEGYLTENSKLRGNIDWAPKHFWGRRDDGLCHNVTREGAAGVSMQNWHLGPIGLQILVDEVVFLYAEAVEMALESIVARQDLPPLPQRVSSIISNRQLGAYNPTYWCAKHDKSNTDVYRLPLPYYLYYCGMTNDELVALRVHCATGSHPQFNGPGFELGNDMFLPAQGDANPFPAIGNNAAKWEYNRIKRPSGIGYATEAKESGYAQRPECSAFIDIGFAVVTSKPAAETEWLTFRVPDRAAETLRGAKRVNIYLCEGQRTAKFVNLGNYTAVFGINGKVWGESRKGPWPSCIRLNAPNPVETFQPGTVFGVRFYLTNPASLPLQPILVGNIQIISADRPEYDLTPRPSRAATAPTHQPVPIAVTARPSAFMPTPQPTVVTQTEEVTEVPHQDDDEGNVEGPTEVPHQGDDEGNVEGPTEVPHQGDDEGNVEGPTEVPHQGDDGDNNGQRRQLRRRRQRRAMRL